MPDVRRFRYIRRLSLQVVDNARRLFTFLPGQPCQQRVAGLRVAVGGLGTGNNFADPSTTPPPTMASLPRQTRNSPAPFFRGLYPRSNLANSDLAAPIMIATATNATGFADVVYGASGTDLAAWCWVTPSDPDVPVDDQTARRLLMASA